MNHLTDQHRQALDSCIEKCEEFITIGQTLKKVCVPGGGKECKNISKTDLNKAAECITAARECAKQCEEHTKTCKDPACTSRCQKCIELCLSVIGKLTKLAEHGVPINQEEIDDSITSCSKCRDACNQMLEHAYKL